MAICGGRRLLPAASESGERRPMSRPYYHELRAISGCQQVVVPASPQHKCPRGVKHSRTPLSFKTASAARAPAAVLQQQALWVGDAMRSDLTPTQWRLQSISLMSSVSSAFPRGGRSERLRGSG